MAIGRIGARLVHSLSNYPPYNAALKEDPSATASTRTICSGAVPIRCAVRATRAPRLPQRPRRQQRIVSEPNVRVRHCSRDLEILPEIRAGLLQRGPLRIGSRELLDDGDVPFRDRLIDGSQFYGHVASRKRVDTGKATRSEAKAHSPRHLHFPPDVHGRCNRFALPAGIWATGAPAWSAPPALGRNPRRGQRTLPPCRQRGCRGDRLDAARH